MKPVFESEHIRFVEVTERLIDAYLAMVNDLENVARFIGRTEPLSEAKERQWVREKLRENAPVFSMIEKQSGAFIGNIELMDVRDAQAELGVAIAAAMQNRGFGKEAIPAIVGFGRERLGLRRIFLKVYPNNARAIHVYGACGFRENGRAGDDVFMEVYP